MLMPRPVAFVVAAVLSGALLLPTASPTAASPTVEAQALAAMKADWAKLSLQQKLGTCNAYRRNAKVMIRTATAGMWQRPSSHKDMTEAGWSRVYKRYFAWACSGAGRSPRP
jgi:hypothetical protein